MSLSSNNIKVSEQNSPYLAANNLVFMEENFYVHTWLKRSFEDQILPALRVFAGGTEVGNRFVRLIRLVLSD